jgi:hypothetical protein
MAIITGKIKENNQKYPRNNPPRVFFYELKDSFYK